MSTSEQSHGSGAPQPPPPGMMGPARMPIPGNAEAFVYVLVVIVVAIVWAASDAVNASGFVTALVVLTAFYMLSRGIAKASRVLEQ
jgi:hypothetical protein